jgi:hypothetical protein
MTENMRIYTDIEFKVDEAIKGSFNENSSVVFTIPEAESMDMRWCVPRCPNLRLVIKPFYI